MSVQDPRYPIGTFVAPSSFSIANVEYALEVLEAFPEKLRAVVAPLSTAEKERTYRKDGWNIKQVVHHCADSHINAYVRFKLTYTEETPTIKPYKDALWANLPDAQDEDFTGSLQILFGIHQRWVDFARTFNEEDWKKCYFHPDQQKNIPLYIAIALYAWHAEHHLAHIRTALGKH